MTFDSSNDTVAILYDIENAPFERLDYTLGKARRLNDAEFQLLVSLN